VRAGFIHVPQLRARGHDGPGLSLAQLVRAIRIAIEVAANERAARIPG
jgi:pyrrolidone-carboxylate peptidase